MIAARAQRRDGGATPATRPIHGARPLVRRLWHGLASQRAGNVLLAAIALGGLAGIAVRQFHPAALLDPAAYADELAQASDRYGAGLSSAFESLGLYHVFTTGWFAGLVALFTISLVGSTVERLPRTWRDVRHPPIVRSRRYFHPGLRLRAGPLEGATVESATAILTRAGYRCRAVPAGGAVHVFAERHRWAPFASLTSHAALVLFVVAMGIVTPRFGFAEALAVPVGDVRPVSAAGSAGNLLVRTEAVDAQFDDAGRATAFATTLAVYRDGREIARKAIQVNDPLVVDGYVFHQNFYGPAVDLVVRDGTGRVTWSQPVLLDGELAGHPEGRLDVPGSDVTLELLLARGEGGEAELTMIGFRPDPAGSGEGRAAFSAVLHPGDGYVPDALPVAVEFVRPSAFVGLIVERDPGQPLVWLGAALLIASLTVSLGFPRRRAWGRADGDGLRLAFQGSGPAHAREAQAIVDAIRAGSADRPR